MTGSDLEFRHVDASPEDPVETWPGEAIQAALERGGLSDWRRLAAAIRADPWGRVARVVEEIAGWGELYGVDALMQRVIASARRDVDAAARARYAAVVRDARARTGLSLRAFARLVGTSSSRMSEYERGRTAPTTEVLGRIEDISGRHDRERRR
ncbi:XRE family transcriptional regulator [Egibacter rhizosphaerae]|uniref:XRE family transcriptional regulator n=1 Tax=Egibacter rhizosphaerae TaxID=1670831 RepID=A0A411YHN1_9ACTN|nr:helix-turn-helix transcriptional regulator [Egibacter rhizosphaerae]QBI20778.1 XRE family transcriptional regulator [Egibacter rhizosphaerae]